VPEGRRDRMSGLCDEIIDVGSQLAARAGSNVEYLALAPFGFGVAHVGPYAVQCRSSPNVVHGKLFDVWALENLDRQVGSRGQFPLPLHFPRHDRRRFGLPELLLGLLASQPRLLARELELSLDRLQLLALQGNAVAGGLSLLLRRSDHGLS